MFGSGGHDNSPSGSHSRSTKYGKSNYVHEFIDGTTQSFQLYVSFRQVLSNSGSCEHILTRSLNFSIISSPNSYVFQDLKIKRMIGLRHEKDGLYVEIFLLIDKKQNTF